MFLNTPPFSMGLRAGCFFESVLSTAAGTLADVLQGVLPVSSKKPQSASFGGVFLQFSLFQSPKKTH